MPQQKHLSILKSKRFTLDFSAIRIMAKAYVFMRIFKVVTTTDLNFDVDEYYSTTFVELGEMHEKPLPITSHARV